MPRDPDDHPRFGPPGPRCTHLCVDMQRLFAEATDWHVPGMARILPNVARIAAAHPADTIFARFVTPGTARKAPGAWRRYYAHWHRVTLAEMAPALLDLVAPLARHAPPATVVDKPSYSPWVGDGLAAELERRGTDTLVVTGIETDVCVLGTVLGAVDRGYRTLVVTDAACSASDALHDAVLQLLGRRFDLQVELVGTDALLEAWPA